MSSNQQFRIEGLNELNTFITNFSPAMAKTFQTITGKYAQSIYSEMYKRVPVKTGYLRSTIGLSSSTNRVEFYVTADYAGAVNYGTYKMQGRPFFTGPLQEQAPKMLQELNNEVERYIASNLKRK